ncbi:guanylate kinase [Leptolinea tardivitalis]|uniref:Guanylate kinase n=1 Tax=Leptolinea tardivitalis TaxID=229920 RepID=A0A0P6X0Q9_9CHLR|nr:guanylate kinase [Leptolinea tardivitalis]KPL72766.1 guanylate kinase [Leptolinea tardivitalis]GAP20882.1 guanylate kinase [Leptolinea tardivitalis]
MESDATSSALANIRFDVLQPSPLLIVISGPSGVGKDAVLNEMKARLLPFHFVVTTTSRKPRPGEVEGVDYNFVDLADFESMIANNELIEYALVYQDYKGIPRNQVTRALQSGKDVVMRLDVQGARKIRDLFPEAVLIFLVPADAKEWYQRLIDRKTETPESLKIRIETALGELNQLDLFDYVVVNAHNRLQKAVDDIEAIIKVEHSRTKPRKINI